MITERLVLIYVVGSVSFANCSALETFGLGASDFVWDQHLKHLQVDGGTPILHTTACAAVSRMRISTSQALMSCCIYLV